MDKALLRYYQNYLFWEKLASQWQGLRNSCDPRRESLQEEVIQALTTPLPETYSVDSSGRLAPVGPANLLEALPKEEELVSEDPAEQLERLIAFGKQSAEKALQKELASQVEEESQELQTAHHFMEQSGEPVSIMTGQKLRSYPSLDFSYGEATGDLRAIQEELEMENFLSAAEHYLFGRNLQATLAVYKDGRRALKDVGRQEKVKELGILIASAAGGHLFASGAILAGFAPEVAATFVAPFGFLTTSRAFHGNLWNPDVSAGKNLLDWTLDYATTASMFKYVGVATHGLVGETSGPLARYGAESVGFATWSPMENIFHQAISGQPFDESQVAQTASPDALLDQQLTLLGLKAGGYPLRGVMKPIDRFAMQKSFERAYQKYFEAMRKAERSLPPQRPEWVFELGGKPATGTDTAKRWLTGFEPEGRAELEKFFAEEGGSEKLNQALQALGEWAEERGVTIVSPLESIEKALSRYGTDEEDVSDFIRDHLDTLTQLEEKGKVPADLLAVWSKKPFSTRLEEFDSIFSYLNLRKYPYDKLEEVGPLSKNGHPLVRGLLKDPTFVGDWYGAKLTLSLQELNDLLWTLERTFSVDANDPRIQFHLDLEGWRGGEILERSLLRLREIVSQASSPEEFWKLVSLDAAEGKKMGTDVFDQLSLHPDQRERMDLIEDQNPQKEACPYAKMVWFASQGESYYRKFLDTLEQNRYVARTLKTFGIDPEVHRRGLGERVVSGKAELLRPEQVHEIQVRKALGVWQMIQGEGVLKSPSRLVAKVRDTVTNGSSLEDVLQREPTKLRAFVSLLIQYLSRSENISDPRRAQEALLLLRRISKSTAKRSKKAEDEEVRGLSEEKRRLASNLSVTIQAIWHRLFHDGIFKDPEDFLATLGFPADFDSEKMLTFIDKNPLLPQAKATRVRIKRYLQDPAKIKDSEKATEVLAMLDEYNRGIKELGVIETQLVGAENRSELTQPVRIQVEKKDPIRDLTIGNDGGCCIGVYLEGEGEGEGEGLSNGIYMPFYLADDATHFIGIYLGKERVGMALLFDGELNGKPAMTVNSIELGKEFDDDDPRVPLVVRGVHEYLEEWGKRDRMVVLESVHDYNTGFLYDQTRGTPPSELEKFRKFHRAGEFYSDTLDRDGTSQAPLRILYSPD